MRGVTSQPSAHRSAATPLGAPSPLRPLRDRVLPCRPIAVTLKCDQRRGRPIVPQARKQDGVACQRSTTDRIARLSWRAARKTERIALVGAVGRDWIYGRGPRAGESPRSPVRRVRECAVCANQIWRSSLPRRIGQSVRFAAGRSARWRWTSSQERKASHASRSPRPCCSPRPC
jgi:hypothetical protein